ncbi:nucleoside hydrolase [Dyadobacter chenhuakuii]|uniref:Nucleoside hydrolase n=1 Tax=Dyadobacter chenhuakuii TaxID=2909339 RepID=A0ABY4XFS3_9BACT|nr:nucleoside hydrolase [Dyadobacter chenhuakuii]MCF2495242.1 nucleoside hydrolase [Dyadobacter chenhuakuii]USJ29284.1 nucleoside hydrolase [Dyadobacter chenhuakuii]
MYSQTGSRLPKTLILDTDIGPDYDDVGAMAVMHALADKGEVRPLAVIASNKNEYVVPTIDLINTFFGRPELPTGAPKGAGAPAFGATQKWPEMLVEKYPHKIKNTADAEDAVTVYRKILAKQPDQSVTIVTIGFLTNLANLLDSKPDAHSPLSGLGLVKKKVSGLVSMAGKFPAGREYNVYADSLASQKVFTEWPTEIIFSGFEIGQEIRTGVHVIANERLKGPVKDAYQMAMSKSKEDANGRQSWDQTAVLVGVRGVQPYFGLKRGKIVITDGNNTWQDDPMGPHAYLTPGMPTAQLTALIEGLMMWEGKK